jgi:hypothetical protein
VRLELPFFTSLKALSFLWNSTKLASACANARQNSVRGLKRYFGAQGDYRLRFSFVGEWRDRTRRNIALTKVWGRADALYAICSAWVGGRDTLAVVYNWLITWTVTPSQQDHPTGLP